MEERIQALALRLEEIDALLASPEIAADAEKMRDLLRERKHLEPITTLYAEYKTTVKELSEAELLTGESDPDMATMAKEEAALLRERTEVLERRMQELLLPRDPLDDRNVIMEIRAGAGGEEAALFAADLFRMYTMFADGEGFRIEPISRNETELGGFREISFMVVGEGAYSRLKYESGVHRVQRIPRTESQGRIQTSTVTVAVLPEVEDVQIEISPSDLEVETLKSSGAGGQHINKTESAVRIYHKPSGIVVFCQEERSQFKNRDKAMRMLRAKLYENEQKKQADQVSAARRSQVGTGDRSEKIRTYNYPQSRITDHRIGMTVYRFDSFLNGDIRELTDALRSAEVAELMKSREA